jgi:acyl transferase domain-containing protein/acyl-CoA synthetase (AMP-forming)/AMP-acid ligase II/acyl carrier protein
MSDTLNTLLASAAERKPQQTAFLFLRDGENDVQSITYGELHQRACGIAAALRSRRIGSARALLLYPPGVDFLSAMFGALYAGVVAVPAHPPGPDRSLGRLEAIASDSEPALVLTTSDIAARAVSVVGTLPVLSDRDWVSTDGLGLADGSFWSAGESEDLAILQYTSGSTGTPKGVECTHANALHNAAYVHDVYSVTEETVSVTWLPHFHDMGLMLGLIQPLYAGVPGVFMPPAAFVQKPTRLLRAISRYRGSFAGGPNFCFDLCVRRTSEAERDLLDLRSWVCAYNGAEPVRRETIERFSKYFAPAGFRSRAFYPALGMAEATAHVCGGSIHEDPVFFAARADALEHGTAVEASGGGSLVRDLVSCGRAGPDTTIVIVDPATLTECADRRVGEIWVANASISPGYWRRPEETDATFRGFVDGRGPFLRTGDLGFVDRGEVFVTGRLKDLIIIRGANHYPQDIERSADSSHPALRSGYAAAFGLEADGTEQLVVVVETVRDRLDPHEREEAFEAIRRRVGEEHDLELYAVCILERGGIFKTSSGKIERKACRRAFETGELPIVAEWRRPVGAGWTATRPPSPKSAREIESWLTRRIAARLGVARGRVDTAKTFAQHGLGSADAVALSGEFQDWYGEPVPPTFFYDHPTIHAVARELARPGPAAQAEAPLAASAEPIAVIGFGCRLPGGVTDADSFWSLLAGGVDAIAEVPADRWDREVLFDANPGAAGRMTTRFGGFLDGIDRFDAGFFEIAPREAVSMDPQQRLLLEVTYEALEDAGQVPDALAGSDTGVFVGICNGDYGHMLRRRAPEQIDAYMSTGTSFAVAGGRIAYAFGFEGPNVAIDTACSASLVAVHLACQSLKSGESSLAIAGGVNVILTPEVSIDFSRANMFAPDGRCKGFDAAADGYVRSEGCGLVVLKRLSDAIRDGDRILGVVRGSAINQDGRSNGLTAPNGRAQQAVIRRALRTAGVEPAEVSYVEAHGSGTPLGDSIELEALKAVFGNRDDRALPCLIGSVKSNIGHLESAAGVAGLIKVLLGFERRAIAPHLHFHRPNPSIGLDGTRLRIATTLESWMPGDHRRIAGVSSFGLSGTNAHVVVEEPPQPTASPATKWSRAYVLPVAARDDAALFARAARFAAEIESRGADTEWLRDAVATASQRRAHRSCRAAVVGEDAAELARGLRAVAANEKVPGVSIGSGRRAGRPIVFVYSGHGSQWVGMGRRLLAEETPFLECLRAVDAALRGPAGFSVIEMLGAGPDDPRWQRVDAVQPAVFAIQIALTAEWRAWGVQPDAVMGHSNGEVAASVVAGALTLEDGARVIATRSRHVLPTCGHGRMALVEMSPGDMQALLSNVPEVSIASYHGPDTVLVSGSAGPVIDLVRALEARGLFARLIDVDFASHSSHMDGILNGLATALAGIRGRPARDAVLCSTVAADLVGGEELNAEYWVRNIREPVRLHESVEKLVSMGYEVFLEVSPHPVLVPTLQRTLGARGEALGSLRRESDEVRELAESLARVFTAGVDVDWSARTEARRPVRLPTYPWQRRRYWVEMPIDTRRAPSAHAWLCGASDSAREAGTHVYQGDLGVGRVPELAHHRIDGAAVVAGAVWLEAALHVAETRGRSACVGDVSFTRLLALDAPAAVHLVATDTGFEVLSAASAEGMPPTRHAAGHWVEATAAARSMNSLARARRACTRAVPASELYGRLETCGLHHGRPWAAVTNMWLGTGEALAEIALGETPPSGRWTIEPWFLDAMTHALAMAEQPSAARRLMPVRVGRLALHRRPSGRAWVEVAWTGSDAGVDGRVRAYDDSGALFLEMDGVQLASVPRLESAPAVFEIEWTRETPAPVRRLGKSAWLVVGDGALAGSVAERLAAGGSSALRVGQNDELLKEVPVCTDVVHLAAAEDDQAERAGVLEPQERGVLSVHSVIRTLLGASRTPRLWLVTRSTQAVREDAVVRVAHAPVWGLARTIEHEHPELSPVCIDLSERPDPETLDALTAELTGDGAERLVALRRTGRFVARLVRRTMGRPRAPLMVSREAAYLITGGLGSLGLAVARALADAGARRLVLLGRSAPGEEARSLVGALAGRGVEIDAVRCDVASYGAVAEAVARIRPPLKGVVHAAGVLHDVTLLNADAAAFDAVFAPKVAGAWNLHRATRDRGLDFFVMFSSAAAVLGSAGQANYAAANAFLDALAHHRRRQGLPALSIDFGPISDVGLAAQSPDRGARLARTGLLGLSAEEAIDVLSALLAGDAAQAMALRYDPALWREHYPRLAQLPFFAALTATTLTRATAAERGVVRRELLQLDPRVRLDRLQQHLCAEIARVLRLDLPAVRPWTPFGGLGLDSIMALELRNRLESSLDLRLPATIMWSHRTVDALAAHLAGSIGWPVGAEPSGPPSEPGSPAGAVAGLSEEEAASALTTALDALDV